MRHPETESTAMISDFVDLAVILFKVCATGLV